ncbi:hypothetical protein J4450_01155 [Candidatus Micrarchaeota archaeon]|nr:hypothetical protein [Candidatus Micrarchaeota archaeon]
MNTQEMRKIFFVITTTIGLAVLLAVLKFRGIEMKQAPLLFVGALLGLIIYMQEKEHNIIAWLLAGFLGFLVFPITYENRNLSQLAIFALIFTIFVLMPPILIKLRERIFTETV